MSRHFTAEQHTAAIAKTTRMLAKQNVRVSTQGARAFIEWKPNGQIKRINLPMVPRDATPEFLDALQGYLDHEVGHAYNTNPVAGRKLEDKAISDHKIKKYLMRGMANIIEDVRIEACMERDYPGSPKNLEAVRRFFVNNYTKPNLDKFDAADPKQHEKMRGYILPVYFRARVGQIACVHFMDDNNLWPIMAEYDAQFPDLPKRLALLKSTEEATELAVEIILGLRKPPPPPQMGEPDEDEEGDGEGESENKNPDQSEDDPGDEEPEEKDEDEGGEGGEGSRPNSKEDEGEDEDEGDEEDEADEADDNEPQDGGGDEDTGDSDEDDEAGDDGEGNEHFDSEEDDEDTGDEAGDEAEDDGDGAGTAQDEDEAEPDDSDEDDGEEQPGDPDTMRPEMEFDPADLADFDEVMANVLEKAVGDMPTDQAYHIFTRDHDLIETAKVHPAAPVAEMEARVNKTAGALRKHLERLMAARSQAVNVPGYRKGRIHPSSLHRILNQDDRLFAKRHEAPQKDTAVGLLIDFSGSMTNAVRGHYSPSAMTKIQTALDAGWVFSQTLDRIKVPNEVLGFTTNYTLLRELMSTGNFSSAEVEKYAAALGCDTDHIRYEPLLIPVLKDFNESFSLEVEKRFASVPMMTECESNIDGEAIRIAASRLARRKEKRKILIVFSDGNPAGSVNHYCLNADTRNAVKETTRAGIETIGIGIADESVRDYYPKAMVITQIDQLSGELMGQLRAILAP